ncbi:hypothetical protein D6C00_06545 [Thiohalobacter thiocyanaticus]|uniref:Uncharacterized protein n=1 Tax=Thiohalobacter thiocyanaticus TaxID=585455 RepID=A0A426QIR3_9GAMM|nr:hypothetical protein D6C00_06545 [Thiohalobacter thiocyanaticus]
MGVGLRPVGLTRPALTEKLAVIPAQAGFHNVQWFLDSRLRGNDEGSGGFWIPACAGMTEDN